MEWYVPGPGLDAFAKVNALLGAVPKFAEFFLIAFCGMS